MVSRTGLQVQRIVPEAIASLQADIQALKSGNQTVGPDSLIVQRVTSGQTWDINGASVQPYITQQFRVVFTPKVMKNAYASFTYTLSVSNATGHEIFYYWPDTSNTSSTQKAWIFTIANDANTVQVYAQFILKCADTGTFTVTQL